MKTNTEIYEKLGEGKDFLLTDYTDNYELYVENQKILNEKKFDRMPGCNDGINVFQEIKKEVLKRNPTPTFGLCHGVRSGVENKILGEILNCKIIGTEIGNKFGNPDITIQWDMHEVKDEWIGECDLVYSNSFDHTYDPIYCLNQWAKTLKRTGVIVLQHGIRGGHHNPDFIKDKKYSPGDPFNAPISVYQEICDNYTPLKIVDIKSWDNTSSEKHLILELR